MDEELKPCPFCGYKPKYKFTYGDYGYTYNRGEIRCTLCGVVMFSETTKSEATTYEGLKSRWNKRV